MVMVVKQLCVQEEFWKIMKCIILTEPRINVFHLYFKKCRVEFVFLSFLLFVALRRNLR